MTNSQAKEQDERENALQVLRNFIFEMNQWESQCWQELLQVQNEGGDLVTKQDRDLQRMIEIFKKHCSPKNILSGRRGSFRNPPEYDPQTEQIIDVMQSSTKKIIIYTQQETGFRLKSQYTLLFKGGRWLIDSKAWQQIDGKWKKSML